MQIENRSGFRRSQRTDGYLPIRDYAAIGDRHTIALVGLGGSIDWLCLPSFDAQFVLGALLDSDRGGRFSLAPVEPHEVARSYVPDTNVLETTFRTQTGSVCVTDALTMGGEDRSVRELVGRVDGVSGEVDLAWRLAPRFGLTHRPARVDRQPVGIVARRDGDAVVVQSWDAGEPWVKDGQIGGSFQIGLGGRALLVLRAIDIADGPLPFAGRAELEQRLDATVSWWREWSAEHPYDGPWCEAVRRSALVLGMLVDGPTGAIVAAPTTGLPESIGGSRNWDYRFCWLRDSSFAVDALMRLGDRREAGRFIDWLMAAAGEQHPRLHPFYRLDGTSNISQEPLDALAGYRGSRPVLQGNGAVDQRQLGNYGDLFQAVSLFAGRGGEIGEPIAERLVTIADYVCGAWVKRDSGIWELGTHLHYTSSKMQCWIALDRARKLAEAGKIPAGHAERWRASSERIQEFVERRCWSDELGAYARSADSDELDAGVLVGIFMDYGSSNRERFNATVDRLREHLGRGPLLYRYTGMAQTEGTFLACAFWMVERWPASSGWTRRRL